MEIEQLLTKIITYDEMTEFFRNIIAWATRRKFSPWPKFQFLFHLVIDEAYQMDHRNSLKSFVACSLFSPQHTSAYIRFEFVAEALMLEEHSVG